MGRRFVALTWLTLAGCMMHARFDFPFQVHSILLLFLVLCAILFTRSRR
jgi:NADH:ubiquinone oxidoreductase subunit 6 (subunit J)